MLKPIVTINDFEGPMDLLLHLVKEKNIDILALDLNVITEQYVNFINSKKKNIDLVSEYLPVAAYLLELQSKQLLPKQAVAIDNASETEFNRQQLLARLLEYKKFKEVSIYFKKQAVKRSLLLTKNPSDLKPYLLANAKSNLLKSDISKLPQAMLKMFTRLKTENKLPVNLTLNLISAEARGNEIKKFLASTPEHYFTLEELFFTKTLTLHYFIITFIAILDLANHQYLHLSQNHIFDEVKVTYRGEKNVQ